MHIYWLLLFSSHVVCCSQINNIDTSNRNDAINKKYNVEMAALIATPATAGIPSTTGMSATAGMPLTEGKPETALAKAGMPVTGGMPTTARSLQKNVACKKVMLARVEIHAKEGRLAKRGLCLAKTPATVFTIP